MPNQGLSLGQHQQQRQTMVMTPQLRQSLQILQMPVMELRDVIIKEMEQNPTIDMSDPTEVMASTIEPEPSKEHPADEEMNFDPDFDQILRQDDEWRDYFMQGLENAPSVEDAEEKRQFLFDSLPQSISLQDHLLEQLNYTELTKEERETAAYLIGNINDAGYFLKGMPDIIMVTGKDEKELRRILAVIQTFDPPGIGCETLRECLLHQIDLQPKSPWKEKAHQLIDHHLDKLASKDDQSLCKSLNVTHEELKQIIALVKSLDPQPGLAWEQHNKTEYVHPEVYVERIKGKYVVYVEMGRLPQIHISNYYRSMLENPKVSNEDKSYIRDKIRSSVFLINSIQQRQVTIKNIAQCIVDAQKEFLDKGIAYLKPMTMVEVAEKAGVHETTVSRTVANKYMWTPVGVFEMKYFFTTGLKNESGQNISNKTIQEKIKQIIESEDHRAPLSDQAIEEILSKEGLHIARRTVSKYRGILKIPAASKRRTL